MSQPQPVDGGGTEKVWHDDGDECTGENCLNPDHFEAGEDVTDQFDPPPPRRDGGEAQDALRRENEWLIQQRDRMLARGFMQPCFLDVTSSTAPEKCSGATYQCFYCKKWWCETHAGGHFETAQRTDLLHEVSEAPLLEAVNALIDATDDEAAAGNGLEAVMASRRRVEAYKAVLVAADTMNRAALGLVEGETR